MSILTQNEKRLYLINALLSEREEYRDIAVPDSALQQQRLLRSLMNVRQPEPVSADFLQIQDEYLTAETAAKGITDISSLVPLSEGLYLWQGDITTLRCDAIVNAANSALLGCFCPCHGCIDNAIHTYAGIQLRLSCAELMRSKPQEDTGRAEITPAYNLPARYVIHTVGPIVSGALTARDEQLLASCYRSCLEKAEENGLQSIAFCCISTGEFHFPNQRAAEIAVETVKKFRQDNSSKIKVIFNVFKQTDYDIYSQLFG